MVVIKKAAYVARCPFTKKLLIPSNIICLFDKKQLNTFKKVINELFQAFLPQDIIELIIKKTGYEKLLYRFGLIDYVLWEKKYNKIKKFYIDSSENDSESDSDSGSESDESSHY